MTNRAMICRALSGHAWEVRGPIIVLEGDARRITFHCPRCEGYRLDTWARKGGVIHNRLYKHSQEYHAFIKEHNRAEAREALLGTLKETTSGKGNDLTLRLVRGQKRRRRNSRSHQRTRDKRRANA